MRRALILVVLAAACGGKQAPATTPAPDDDLTIGSGGSGSASGSARPQTELERRRDAACEQVGAKVAACAAEDTRSDKVHPPSADELAQLDQTAAIDKREYVKKCEAQDMSSRQVRVMEVCLGAETQCDPFVACLANMNPKP